MTGRQCLQKGKKRNTTPMVMKDEFWQLSKTYHLNYLIRTTRILYFVVINKKKYAVYCAMRAQILNYAGCHIWKQL